MLQKWVAVHFKISLGSVNVLCLDCQRVCSVHSPQLASVVLCSILNVFPGKLSVFRLKPRAAGVNFKISLGSVSVLCPNYQRVCLLFYLNSQTSFSFNSGRFARKLSGKRCCVSSSVFRGWISWFWISRLSPSRSREGT